MYLRSNGLRLFSRLVGAATLILWSGCSLLQPLQEFPLSDLGHFEYRHSDRGRSGLVVGVPHGRAEPGAVDYAVSIRDATGAGLVVAYDFAGKRITVAEPLLHQAPISWTNDRHSHHGGVFPEFKKLLQAAVGGPIQFYVGVRVADTDSRDQRIEVAAGGFSFEQLLALKAAYGRLIDGVNPALESSAKVAMAVHPLDDLSWKSFGVRNHGVLLVAERGLILRLPRSLADRGNAPAYRQVLAAWVKDALKIAENGDRRQRLPAFTAQRTIYGRIDSIAARSGRRGVVLGAPHGSFDWHTAELVEELSYRTSLAAAVTRGFTPTETNGWRINVNRPTELRYPTEGIGRQSQRAEAVFNDYARTVLELARGALDLYIEMHQSGPLAHIDVATVGVAGEEARAIKTAYGAIRDRVLQENPGVDRVELLIEPIDPIEIGAWAAKDQGMLKLAKTALHFELPAYRVLQQDRTRRVYSQILAELIERMVQRRPELASNPDGTYR